VFKGLKRKAHCSRKLSSILSLISPLRRKGKLLFFTFCFRVSNLNGEEFLIFSSSRISPSPFGRDSFETYYKNQIFEV